MKQSSSQIFNISLKTQNNSLNSICSLKKNTISNSEKTNKSLTCLNFPKIYSKLKYTRNNQKILKNSLTSQTNYTREIKKPKINLNINSTLRIFHYPSKENLTSINTSNVFQNTVLEQNKTNSKMYNFKFFKPLNERNAEYYNEFITKGKKNAYTKFLSESYRKNNRKIIDIFNIRYKQKQDSILNVIQKDNCYFIQGRKYNKYFFLEHEKMNYLLFHQKIMDENKQRFAKKKKIENLKKLMNKNINDDRRRSISTEDIFIKRAIDKRKTRRNYTKFFYTKNNLKKKIENMVQYEINRAIANSNSKNKF